MSENDNKACISGLFTARSQGDYDAFIRAMADDFVWRITGSSAWSGDYIGKAAVQKELLEPFHTQFAAPPSLILDRILADGDYVIVQCRGDAATLSGGRYANTYCLVIRMFNGKLQEMTEYMDTAMIDRILQPPPSK